ncbi:MAG: DUF4388 domain-containing protein [Myxococcota bacterium]
MQSSPIPDPGTDQACNDQGWALQLRPGAGACLAGDLQRVSLSSVVDIIAQDRITGTLRVRAGAVERSVSFCRGEARQASSRLPHERFGAIAVGMGILKQEDIRELLSYDHDAPIGRVAVDWGLLSDHSLWRVMQEHIVTVFQGILSEDGGLFLVEGIAADHAAEVPGFATKALFREATSRAEQLERMRAEMPAGSRLELVGEVRHALPRDQGALVYELMDGPLSLAELCSRLHCPEFQVMKAVAGLSGAGHVRVASPDPRQHDEGREMLARSLALYNRVFREIREACVRAGAGEVLARATEASLQEEPVLSEPLQGIRLLPDGALPEHKVLARFEDPGLAADERRALLLRELHKLTKFLLFFAGERLDPLVHEALYQRVKKALRPA